MDFVFSPLDRRYKTAIPEILSEEASFTYQVEVEVEWLKTLRDEGICPKFSDAEIDRPLTNVSFTRVEEIEKRTHHATRALVEAIAEQLTKDKKPELARWVHVGLTSFDTVDTAARLRLKKYLQTEYEPLLEKTLAQLKKKATEHAHTLQAGRTHGQWAVPTFFGVSLGESFARLSDLNGRLHQDIENLRGQASGAIGGYHALSLITKDPLGLEKKFLKRLGLKAHFGSTQIIPPEDIVQAAQTVYLQCSVIAKMATDWRHLARSEISEVAEAMAEGQVGSSTMPQKRNPWNLEHVCSLFKVLKSKLQLLQEDLISEHQRDLTNSASGRFYFEFFAVAHLMLHRFSTVFEKLQVDKEQMAKNFSHAGSSIYAEAFYVALTQAGADDAHHQVREAARESEKTGKDLLTVLQSKKLLNSSMTLDSLKEKILEGSQKKLKAIFS